MPDRLAQAVRSGQLHPREREQHALDHMAAAGELNAVTKVCAEQTLAKVVAMSMAVLKEEFNGAANTMPFNLTGHPAMSVPIGVQIVAPQWRDDLCCGPAESIKRIAPWPLAAPGHTPFGHGLP